MCFAAIMLLGLALSACGTNRASDTITITHDPVIAKSNETPTQLSA
jgi:hypothetical protein